MHDHCDLKSGVWPENAADSDSEMVAEGLKDGAIPCVVSQRNYDNDDITIGQIYTAIVRINDEKIHVKAVVVGIIEENDNGDFFWDKRLRTYDRTLFTNKEYK